MPARTMSPLQQIKLLSHDYDFSNQIHKQPLPYQHQIGRASKSVVRFIEVPQVRETISLENITAEEKKATWYDTAFFLNNRAMIKESISKMLSDFVRIGEIKTIEDEHCMRGLESKTPDGFTRRSWNKYEAISAVLEEQRRQLVEGINDAGAIANVYEECTKHCRDSAQEIGIQDEKAASV